MPPKNKIKIVDVVDKEFKHGDDYTITNDEIEKSELPIGNEPLETTEETTANIQERDEGTAQEISTDTTTPESTKQITYGSAHFGHKPFRHVKKHYQGKRISIFLTVPYCLRIWESHPGSSGSSRSIFLMVSS